MVKDWLKVILVGIMFLATSSLLVLATFFRPSVGSIIVTTNPSGAEIWLDGRLIAKTPAKLEDVPTGNHKIKLGKEGFYSIEQDTKVNEKQTTTLPLYSLQPNQPNNKNTNSDIASSPSERIKEFRRLAEESYNKGDYILPIKSSAFYFSNAVLAINPTDSQANLIIKNVHDALSKDAEIAWQKNDLGTALLLYTQIKENFPEDVVALENLKRLQIKLTARRNMIPHLLHLGENALNNDRLIAPNGNNAYYFVSQVLSIEPTNQQALDLKLQIKEALLAQAEDLTSRDDLQAAVKTYERMLYLFPEDSRIPSKIQILTDQIEQQSNATKRE